MAECFRVLRFLSSVKGFLCGPVSDREKHHRGDVDVATFHPSQDPTASIILMPWCVYCPSSRRRAVEAGVVLASDDPSVVDRCWFWQDLSPILPQSRKSLAWNGPPSHPPPWHSIAGSLPLVVMVGAGRPEAAEGDGPRATEAGARRRLSMRSRVGEMG